MSLAICMCINNFTNANIRNDRLSGSFNPIIIEYVEDFCCCACIDL